ncbi:hypothetical protein VTG60DRAFT_4495 [Thermothelomyces hinnuleus]
MESKDRSVANSCNEGGPTECECHMSLRVESTIIQAAVVFNYSSNHFAISSDQIAPAVNHALVLASLSRTPSAAASMAVESNAQIARLTAAAAWRLYLCFHCRYSQPWKIVGVCGACRRLVVHPRQLPDGHRKVSFLLSAGPLFISPLQGPHLSLACIDFESHPVEQSCSILSLLGVFNVMTVTVI